MFYSSKTQVTDKSVTFLESLQNMFPERREEELRAIVEKDDDKNEAIDSLLPPRRAKIKKDGDVNSPKFEILRELLEGFQRSITSDVYVLKVCRDEIWRCGMGFYKKAMKDPNILVKDFEVLYLLLISKV